MCIGINLSIKIRVNKKLNLQLKNNYKGHNQPISKFLMNTCQYYIKRSTNNPRLCKKNAAPRQYVVSKNAPDVRGGNCTFPTLNLCNHHFNIIDKQIIQDENSCPKNMRDEYLCAQIASMLQFRQDEFNMVIAGTTDPSDISDPSEAHPEPQAEPEWDMEFYQRYWDTLEAEAEAESRSSDDDVKFIEQRSESEVLDRKMEEAKRDGRYIDLTEEKSIEHIECPVCLDKFSPQNVTFLQCVHPMCNDCFSNIVKRNIAQQCPVCRHPFQENLI